MRAQGLLAAGVGEQERVAFLDKNGFEHFEIMFGAAMINAVRVDVNWRLAASEVEFIVNDTEARVLDVGPPLVTVDQHAAPVQISATNDWPAV